MRERGGDRLLLKHLLRRSPYDNDDIELCGLFAGVPGDAEDHRVKTVQSFSKSIRMQDIDTDKKSSLSRLMTFGEMNLTVQDGWFRAHNAPLAMLMLGCCFDPTLPTHELELDMKGAMNIFSSSGRHSVSIRIGTPACYCMSVESML